MTQPVALHEAAASGKLYDITLRSGRVYRKQEVVCDKYYNDDYPRHRYWTAGGLSYTRYGNFLDDGLESKFDIVKMELSEEVPESDPINPSHYDHPSGVQCIQITEQFPFNRGNAIKYIWRAGRKGCPIEDLRKAAWYIEREIQRIQNS